jgi:hypothetical protein
MVSSLAVRVCEESTSREEQNFGGTWKIGLMEQATSAPGSQDYTSLWKRMTY